MKYLLLFLTLCLSQNAFARGFPDSSDSETQLDTQFIDVSAQNDAVADSIDALVAQNDVTTDSIDVLTQSDVQITPDITTADVQSVDDTPDVQTQILQDSGSQSTIPTDSTPPAKSGCSTQRNNSDGPSTLGIFGVFLMLIFERRRRLISH